MEDVPLVEFMYLVYNTRKPGENICRRFGAVSVQCLLTANKHLFYIYIRANKHLFMEFLVLHYPMREILSLYRGKPTATAIAASSILTGV